MSKDLFTKIYESHAVIVYDNKTKEVVTAWGFNIEEKLKKLGIKYWPERYYLCGYVKVYNNEIKYIA